MKNESIKWIFFDSPDDSVPDNWSLGICTKTQKAILSTLFREFPLHLKMIAVSLHGCSLGDHCLNLQCPLNHTTFRSYKHHKLGQSLRDYQNDLHIVIDFQEMFGSEFESLSDGSIITLVSEDSPIKLEGTEIKPNVFVRNLR